MLLTELPKRPVSAVTSIAEATLTASPTPNNMTADVKPGSYYRRIGMPTIDMNPEPATTIILTGSQRQFMSRIHIESPEPTIECPELTIEQELDLIQLKLRLGIDNIGPITPTWEAERELNEKRIRKWEETIRSNPELIKITKDSLDIPVGTPQATGEDLITIVELITKMNEKRYSSENIKAHVEVFKNDALFLDYMRDQLMK